MYFPLYRGNKVLVTPLVHPRGLFWSAAGVIAITYEHPGPRGGHTRSSLLHCPPEHVLGQSPSQHPNAHTDAHTCTHMHTYKHMHANTCAQCTHTHAD